MLLLIAVLACSPLESTGPDGMVGRVTTADGVAVEGLRVSSVEADARTQADGRFAVAYKAPEQHIRLAWGATSITRRYHPDDDGKVVALRLPAFRTVTLVCPPVPCAFEATWALPEGFEATFRTKCREAGARIVTPELLAGTPEARCTVGKGRAANVLPLKLHDADDVFELR